jgi:gentisate 1,2-dioxygenase
VVTPPWAWHDHGNLGAGPVVWMDGLDTPFAQIFGAHFRENYPQVSHPVTSVPGNNAQRLGANMLPLGALADVISATGGNGATGVPNAQYPDQLLLYPFERSRAALHALAHGGGAPHPVHGHKLRYNNPATGGHPFKTIAAFMQLLPAEFKGQPYRATDGTVFNVAQGQCRVKTGGQVHELQTHDVLVIPPWETYAFEADTACVLFSFSDRAAQELLGYWREECLSV